MTDTITHLAFSWPVTKAWADHHNVNGYDAMEREELERRRQKLLTLSMQRSLNEIELDNLDSITAHINARNGVDWMAGRALAEVGFEGVDQIHGQSTTLKCGCVLHHVFDHHKRHDEDLKVHPHHGHKLCDNHHKRHGHLDLADLHAQLLG